MPLKTTTAISSPTADRLMSLARERYLLTLYKLQRHAGGEAVSMGSLAAGLAVSPGSATTMIKRLARAGFVAYTPYSGVRLTRAGRQVALLLVRRHRLLECFLVGVLAYDWSDVHAVAESLEHGVDDALLDRIDAYLGHPVADPHGNPIPRPEGVILSDDAVPLPTCQPAMTSMILATRPMIMILATLMIMIIMILLFIDNVNAGHVLTIT